MTKAPGAPPHLPGPHAVGRRTVVLTDPDRADRAVTVDLWHPAPPEAREAPRSAYTFLPGVAYDSVLAAADVEPATRPSPTSACTSGCWPTAPTSPPTSSA